MSPLSPGADRGKSPKKKKSKSSIISDEIKVVKIPVTPGASACRPRGGGAHVCKWAGKHEGSVRSEHTPCHVLNADAIGAMFLVCVWGRGGGGGGGV
jgi:hypothetical protein